MSDRTCFWSNDDAITLIHNKKAVEACMFLMFVYYTALSIFSEMKNQTEVSKHLLELILPECIRL